jgi:hypothetical protein
MYFTNFIAISPNMHSILRHTFKWNLFSFILTVINISIIEELVNCLVFFKILIIIILLIYLIIYIGDIVIVVLIMYSG